MSDLLFTVEYKGDEWSVLSDGHVWEILTPDGDMLFTCLNTTAAPSVELARVLLRIYFDGREHGEAVGKVKMRSEIRRVLGL